MKIDRRPPVFVLRQPLIPDARPVTHNLGPTAVAVLESFFPAADLRDIPFTTDRGMEDLIRPIVVLYRTHQWYPRGEPDLPLVTFARLGHQPLFDVVEDRVSFDGCTFRVESQ